MSSQLARAALTTPRTAPAAGPARGGAQANVFGGGGGRGCSSSAPGILLCSPGTVPPLSGECYGCGKLSVPSHRRNECPGPAVPPKESIFRGLCAKYLRDQVAVNVVLEGDELAWMDFAAGEGEQGFGVGLSE
ncbi:hypothetical protein R3P38DRAFT_2807949 [Favolaschia claudopus]|uniref:Uncharacterized protein n=1 Tax=Favolaschia claudopus TaxID=2862362 RepID=A0AAV9ZHB2_9AGAR